MPKLLIADDNKQIVSVISQYAKKEGLDIIAAYDGQTALELFEKEKPDIAILDIMMPKLDGFGLCGEIRKQSDIPILMLTAKGEDYEKIMALDIGADDYIVKPFSPRELMARVRANLRRYLAKEKSTPRLVFGNLEIVPDDYSVSIDGTQIKLTRTECLLLIALASNPNKVFSRSNLLDSVWGYDYIGESRMVDNQIKRLRAKLDAYEHKDWQISTVWGIGYKFEVQNEK